MAQGITLEPRSSSLLCLLLASVLVAVATGQMEGSGGEPSEDPSVTAAPPGVSSAILVSCTTTGMTVKLAKSSLLFYKASEINFNDNKCKARETENYFVIETKLDGCGTIASGDDTLLSFKNTIRGVEDPIERIITKKSPYSQDVYCIFNKNTRAMLATQLQPTLPALDNSDVKIDVPFNVQLELNDAEGNSLASGAILPVEAGEMVYFSASTDSPQLDVAIKRCFVTSTTDPDDDMYYDLISDGCPVDPTVVNYGRFDSGARRGQRYSFESFAFVKDTSLPLYLHCDVVSCRQDDEASFCKSSCENLGKRSLMRRSHARKIGQLSAVVIAKH